MDSIWRNRLIYAAAVAALLVIWHVAAIVVGLDIILPGPLHTLSRLGQVVGAPDFWGAVAATMVRGLVGFGVSAAAGVVLGLAAGVSPGVAGALQPAVSVMRATPVISIILLTLIWFRSDTVPIVVAFLMTFPVVYGNVREGIRNVDGDLVEMARTYRVGFPRVIREIYLPSILPYLIAGFSATLGMTWKVIVAAEVLSQPARSIGGKLLEAKVMLDTASVLAWTLIAILLSSLSEGLLRLVERRVGVWKPT